MLSKKLRSFLLSLPLLLSANLLVSNLSAVPAPVKILPLGDSITSDWGDSAYRDELFDKLTAAGYDFEFVGSLTDNDGTSVDGTKHEGHSGWRADHILDGNSGEPNAGKLTNWLNSYDVDIALIHIGTNDILQGESDGSTRVDIRKILVKLNDKNSDVKLFLAKLLPLGRTYATDYTYNPATGELEPKPDAATDLTNDYSAHLNAIMNIAWVRDLNVYFDLTMVDQYTGFTENHMRSDMIHPNAQGEEKMAQNWFNALVNKPIMPPKITISAPASHTMVGTFSVTGSSKSNGIFTYMSSSPNNCSVTPAGVVTPVNKGKCVITISQTAGNDNSTPPNKYAATSTSKTIKITLAPQTIIFAPLTDKQIGSGNVTLSATGGASGNPVVFSTSSSACSISGNTVTLNEVGKCTVKASQSGNNKYEYAEVIRSFEVTAKTVQTIIFAKPADVIFGSGNITLSATGGTSGKPVIFSSNSSACTVTPNGVVTLVTVGSCEIKANQEGDATHSPAAEVSQSFEIKPIPQTITFTVPDTKILGSDNITLSATGGASGKPVTFSTDSASCTITPDGVLTLVAIGTCTIKANQEGDSTHAPAAEVSQSFEIIAMPQEIIEITTGKSTKTISSATLKTLGLKHVKEEFDYTTAIKNGTYKNKKQPTLKELQVAIDTENKGNIKTAGSSSAVWLLLLGVIALYRRFKPVKITVNRRHD